MDLEKKDVFFVLTLNRLEIKELIHDGGINDQWWDDFDYDELKELYEKESNKS